MEYIVVTVCKWEAESAEEAQKQAQEVQSLYEGDSFSYAAEDKDSLAHPSQVPDTFLNPA